MVDLLLALCAWRVAEIVSDSRAGHVQPQTKTLSPELVQVFVRNRLRKVVRGQLGSLQLHPRTVLNEVG